MSAEYMRLPYDFVYSRRESKGKGLYAVARLVPLKALVTFRTRAATSRRRTCARS